MRIKKYISLILAVLMVAVSISGCTSKQPDEVAEEEKSNDKIEIGMCFDSFVIERWEKDRDIFVSVARELGAEVNVQNANGNIDEQIKQIEYFIEKNVDAIVIVSIDGPSLEDVVKKAKNKGIRVVAYDRLIPNAGVDLYVSFDNEMVGKMMATALLSEEVVNNKVIMLQGPTTDNNVSLVYQGFKKVMDKNGVEIIDTMNAEGWKAELAADYIYDHPDIINEVDGIMCGNDNVATAVVRVLSEKRMAGKINVVGQDADLEACQRIVEGTQLMTVYKPVEKEAQKAAEATVAIIKGEELTDSEILNDGSQEINSIVLDPIAVNKSNMDSVIINSGFHLKEDVYLNVAAQ